MAGITPIVSSLMPVVNTVSGLFDDHRSTRAADDAARQAAEQQARDQQLALLQARQQLEQGQLQASQQSSLEANRAQAQNRLDQLTADADAAEKKRRAALGQAMAKTRASLGARGVGTEGGSGEALLLGLVNASGEDRQADQTSLQLRTQALNQQLDDQYRTNLLEQSQLADRQRLRLLSAFD